MKKTLAIVVVLAKALMLSGIAAADTLSYDMDPSAKLKKVAMYQQSVRKASSEQLVVFEVTVQNVGDEPRLYSVIVHVPGVGAGEDFVPAQGEEKIAPGEEAMASVAVLAAEFPTSGYSITVRAVDER